MGSSSQILPGKASKGLALQMIPAHSNSSRTMNVLFWLVLLSNYVYFANASSALCAYQSQVGHGNNGLSGNIVVYDATYMETCGSNCYLAASTGKFMAGKSGVYQISISADSGYTKDDKYFNVFLRISSPGGYQNSPQQIIAHQRAIGTSALAIPLNAIRFISLQQGEKAWLEYECSDGLTSSSCAIYKLKFCVSLYEERRQKVRRSNIN